MQRMGLYTRFHAGILLHLLALSAIIADLFGRLHHRLITAASQGQIDRRPGKFIILRIGESVQADPDADRNRHFVADIDRFHIIKDIKTLLAHLRHRLFAQDHEVFILLHLPADPIKTSHILIDFSVDQRDQKGAPHFFHTFKRLVIIVQIDRSHSQGLVIILFQGDLQGCFIEQIHGEQAALILFFLNDTAVAGNFPKRYSYKFGNVLAIVERNLKLRTSLFLRRKPVLRHGRKK